MHPPPLQDSFWQIRRVLEVLNVEEVGEEGLEL